ncbi:MAG: catechol 2,3-dioxygenase-like lactoylglutathione lyase family enzyme [Roseivirga sp.]|jgi:catechol 2,3-dioxygenase-like lactoylglutathione lyase family enzyme
MKKYLTIFICLLFVACNSNNDVVLASFEVYCEMVANGAKPIALSPPYAPTEADALQSQFETIATSQGLKIYRENEFPETSLFPKEGTEGKSVFIIYKEAARLTQYEQLKKDASTANLNTMDLARRLGRLLGYDALGINNLLMSNSEYKSYASFGIEQQTTHFYYEDVPKAIDFYSRILGFEKDSENQFQISENVFIKINPTSEEHPAKQAKSTAIAFLTDQLPAWYAHVQKEGVEIKYTYKPSDGGPHDGFVAIDPEGYLLEFEEFKQHPENELFMAALALAPKVETTIKGLSFYASITWTYHQDMLRQERFYNEDLGFQLVADQGWTKIYQTSASGFIGLVDEKRGMENYADNKAVELEWKVKDLSALEKYLNLSGTEFYGTMVGPERYAYRFR